MRPLIAAVRHWRQALPRGHRVSALVVVHPTAEGELALPAATAPDLAWARACDAVRDIRAHRLPDVYPVAVDLAGRRDGIAARRSCHRLDQDKPVPSADRVRDSGGVHSRLAHALEYPHTREREQVGEQSAGPYRHLTRGAADGA